MRRLSASARLLLAAGLYASLGAAPARAEGMPQLDFANHLTLTQVVWLAIIFAGLYYLLSRWALPQVGAVLEQRAATIAADLETARLAKQQADAAAAEVIRATRDAQASAGAQVADAVARAQAEAASAAATQNASLDQQLAAAERRIGAARDSALAALRQVATEAASTVVARLTGHAPEAARLDTAVSEALSTRGLA